MGGVGEKSPPPPSLPENSGGAFAWMCACAGDTAVGIGRHLGKSWSLTAGYKPVLRKQRRSAAGLNQCYGWFMDCAHPISALIKQEHFGSGGSIALKIISLFTRARRLHCATAAVPC